PSLRAPSPASIRRPWPFFFHSSPPPPYPHSFPTRRSSDLLDSRRHLLIGRLDDAEHMIAKLDPEQLPPALGVSHELIVAGIAIRDRKSTRLNSSHVKISYAVFCLKKKIHKTAARQHRPQAP